jgi:hypothetical protein
MTDIRSALGAQRVAGEVARHRHRWGPLGWVPNPYTDMTVVYCLTCDLPKDEAKSKRGKTARRRGNDYERAVAARLGIDRVGQYGGKPDVQGEWIVIQAKNGGAFPERLWKWLQELPHDSSRLRAVVIGDAPGPGSKRREVIVLDLADFMNWFGR